MEVAVRGKLFEALELGQIGDPAIADFFGDERGEAGVGLEQPAARGDAVGLVVETLGPQLVEILEEGGLEQLGVQGGHAVDRVRGHHGEIGHADFAHGAFLNERHPHNAVVVARIARGDFAQEAAVDFVDDLQVARQNALEEFNGPALQRLGHEGVVGVAEGAQDNAPCVVPLQMLLIQQQAHQLGSGEGGVGIVELDGHLVGEGMDFVAVGPEAAQDVVERAGDEEVLLLEAQVAPLLNVVVGVQHLGDVFGEGFGLVGLHVLAGVEEGEVEFLGGLGRPQAQVVDGVVAVAGDGQVVGHAQHSFIIHPAGV